MRHTAIFQSAMLLALAALGVSAATPQTDFPFAAGVDSTGWAQAQSNADGHVLIESPQYPHGLWLHLVDETGDALDGIQVEYQGRPDSLVVIRCIGPVGSVRETLIWTRPDGDPLRLTLKPSESTDLPAGLTAIDWQIDPTAEVLLVPEQKTRLEGWEAVAAFLRERWQGQTGRVAVQLDASTSFAVELDHPEAVETLVDRLKQLYLSKGLSPGEGDSLEVQVYEGSLDLLEGVIAYPSLFEDAYLERTVRETLGRPQGRLTFEDVASLTHLETYETYGNIYGNIYSLVGLDYFISLQVLDLSGNQITDVGPLAGLTNLQSLRLLSNQITDVGPLAGLTNLQSLNLFNNQIADVGPLAGLTNLQSLILTDNQIADVRPLAGLTNLRSLYLPGNQLTDVEPLAGLTNLHSLRLGNNQLTDVEPLAGLANLRSLYLPDNQLTDVEPLAGLTNLRSLDLSSNQIADVGLLAGLTNLRLLYLRNNQIEDLAPLIANPALGEGDEVYLLGNPLSDQALNEQIPTLQARGVEVIVSY